MPYDFEYKLICKEYWANGNRKYIKWSDGEEHFYNDNGYLHRSDGPAVKLPNGDELWYYNNKLCDVKNLDEFIIKNIIE